MPSDNGKYLELFEFHSAPETPQDPVGAVVFGRKDMLVAKAFADLAQVEMVKWAIITGGVGKDSGDLQIPEAEYLAQAAELYAGKWRIILPPFYLETQAKNGGENCRNSLDVIRRARLQQDYRITAVAHATSLRRLAHTLRHTAVELGLMINVINREPSRHQFDPSNPADRDEVIAETKRLLDWPAKGWLQQEAADEVPPNLADFVRDTTKA